MVLTKAKRVTTALGKDPKEDWRVARETGDEGAGKQMRGLGRDREPEEQERVY
jgi:hypothetical protein